MHYTICDYITDITQNSIEAGATVVTLDVVDTKKFIKITITDNGKGMDSETIKKAIDPFFTDAVKKHKRKIGLGLPFIVQAIEQSKGEIFINSQPEHGTTINFLFNKENIDVPPIGDKTITYLSLFNYPGDFNLSINETNGDKSFSCSKQELKNILGDTTTTENLNLLKQFIKDNIL